jgi:hypothetical protein
VIIKKEGFETKIFQLLTTFNPDLLLKFFGLFGVGEQMQQQGTVMKYDLKAYNSKLDSA